MFYEPRLVTKKLDDGTQVFYFADVFFDDEGCFIEAVEVEFKLYEHDDNSLNTIASKHYMRSILLDLVKCLDKYPVFDVDEAGVEE